MQGIGKKGNAGIEVAERAMHNWVGGKGNVRIEMLERIL